MKKQTKTITICGKEVSKNFLLHHYKSCPICNKELSLLLETDKYDKYLQQAMNEVDGMKHKFKQKISEILPIPIYGEKLLQHVYEVTANKKKIYPENGTYKCVCGFRFVKEKSKQEHGKYCETYQKFAKETLDSLLNIDLIKLELVDNGLTVQEYVKKYTGENYTAAFYNKTMDYVKQLISEGKLNYKIKSVGELLKDKRIFEKHKETVKKKYGVDNVSKSSAIKSKKVLTSLKNYGVSHHLKVDEIKEKQKETVRQKYGVDNVSQLEEVKNKKKQTFQEHYGVDNIFSRSDLMKEFWKESLSVENPVFDETINKKRLEKILSNYGFLFQVTINDKQFKVASLLETYILEYLITRDIINNIKVNEDYFTYTDENGKTQYYLADITYFDIILEVKTDTGDLPKAIESANQNRKHFMLLFCDNKLNIAFVVKYNTQKVYRMITNSDNLKNKLSKYFPSLETRYFNNYDLKTWITEIVKPELLSRYPNFEVSIND